MVVSRLSDLSHLHLHPGNFTPNDIYLHLHPDAGLFPELIEGEVLCVGTVGKAAAGTFCDLHDDTMFVMTTEGKYYYELQSLGTFRVGDIIKITLRGGQLVAEKISWAI